MTNVRLAQRRPMSREEFVIEQAADRLYEEFDSRFSRPTVVAVLRRCVDDLAGVPRGAIPELGERLARQRLLDTLDRHVHEFPPATNFGGLGGPAVR